MTEHWKGVSLIKPGWHNKPPFAWTLQTKLFQNCCNSKAPMTVQWYWWGFYSYDILLQFLSNLIWAPSSLSYRFLFERWLRKHQYPTETPSLGCCPFLLTNEAGLLNGHSLLFINRGMAPGYWPFLELRESSSLVWLKFTLLLHVLSNQGAQPRAELERFWGTAFLGRGQKNSQVCFALLGLFFFFLFFKSWWNLLSLWFFPP